MNIELIIDKDFYDFIKEHRATTINYFTKVKINDQEYLCNYNNDTITNGLYTLPKTFSRISILDKIVDLDVINKIANNVLFEIKINDSVVKFYASYTVTMLYGESNVFIDDLVFIEN